MQNELGQQTLLSQELTSLITLMCPVKWCKNITFKCTKNWGMDLLSHLLANRFYRAVMTVFLKGNQKEA